MIDYLIKWLTIWKENKLVLNILLFIHKTYTELGGSKDQRWIQLQRTKRTPPCLKIFMGVCFWKFWFHNTQILYCNQRAMIKIIIMPPLKREHIVLQLWSIGRYVGRSVGL